MCGGKDGRPVMRSEDSGKSKEARESKGSLRGHGEPGISGSFEYFQIPLSNHERRLADYTR